MRELKKCPKCRQSVGRFVISVINHVEFYSVECHKCFYKREGKTTKKEALNVWGYDDFIS